MMLANGNIPDGIKYLYAAVIDFIVEFYTNLEVRYQDLEYTASQSGEVKAEFFPHFPTLFKRPLYVHCPHSADTWALYCVLLLSSEESLWVQKDCSGRKPSYHF